MLCDYVSLESRNYTHKVLSTLLLKHELINVVKRTGKVQTFQPNTRNLKLLSNTESKRNSPLGMSTQIVYTTPNDLHKIYTTNIIQNEQLVIMFKATGVYPYECVCVCVCDSS